MESAPVEDGTMITIVGHVDLTSCTPVTTANTSKIQPTTKQKQLQLIQWEDQLETYISDHEKLGGMTI